MRSRFSFTARNRYRRPDPSLVAIPLLLMAAIATADALIPADVHLGSLLVVAPALTVAVAGAVWTAATGMLAVLTLLVIGGERGSLYSLNLDVELGSLVLLSALLVVFCIARERRDDELARVRAVAEATQHVLLRPLPTRVGSLSIASHYRTAEAEAHIGGDLYAIARTFGGTRLIIGDVSGRGLASINETAMLLGAFRAAAHRHAPLPELMAYLEGSVRWGLTERSADRPDEVPEAAVPGAHAARGSGDRMGLEAGERFVTAAVVEIPDDEPVIRVVNCGHPPPLLVRERRATPLTPAEPAPPLGLGELLEVGYEVATYRFAQGDVLLLYTDGLSEARDGEGAFYPLAARLPALWTLDPESLLTELAKDLRDYTGHPLDDDLAMVAVERLSLPLAPLP
jgi:hypothetical protein